jgi:hypothetical protein
MAARLADKLWDISDIVKLIERWELGATEGNPVRCYFMKDGHIAGVEYLTATEDQARIDEARKLFEATGRPRGAMVSRFGTDPVLSLAIPNCRYNQKSNCNSARSFGPP